MRESEQSNESTLAHFATVVASLVFSCFYAKVPFKINTYIKQKQLEPKQLQHQQQQQVQQNYENDEQAECAIRAKLVERAARAQIMCMGPEG